MTARRTVALLVAAWFLGGCNPSTERGEQTHTSATAARPTAADRAALQADLEWLLSPAPPCPPPAHLASTPTTQHLASMLELLGLEPAATPRCPEGDQEP